jgi:hypothetical protein
MDEVVCFFLKDYALRTLNLVFGLSTFVYGWNKEIGFIISKVKLSSIPLRDEK